jgi:hypothetical protein
LLHTTEYTDASTQHEPRFTLIDAYSQTDESHGTTLPPYTSKPEHEIVKDALDRAYPRIHNHESDMEEMRGGLEAMAEYAEAYEKINKGTGLRCDYIERSLKEKQEQTMKSVDQGESRSWSFGIVASHSSVRPSDLFSPHQLGRYSHHSQPRRIPPLQRLLFLIPSKPPFRTLHPRPVTSESFFGRCCSSFPPSRWELTVSFARLGCSFRLD